MVVFWILAAAMTAVALAFVLVPLLRSRTMAGPSEADANLEVLRSHRREIEADVAAGTLAPESREEALAELVGRAADDLARPEPAPIIEARRAWVPAAVAGIGIPALAFGLYAAIGSPLATDPAIAAAARGATDEKHVAAMVEQLALKVKGRPDDAQGWELLARSLAAMERFRESAEAYAHLVTLVPNDAQVLADYADALGMAQGRKLAGKPTELVDAALKVQPNHRKALALAGTAAMERGDLPAAAGYWQRLRAELPPDSPDVKEVEAILADLDQRAGRKLAAATPGPRLANGAAPAPQVAAAPTAAKPAAAAAGASVTGTVTLSPELAARVNGGEALFVFARADGGPRTPLAVIRGTARELPLAFTLDDSLAMAPGVNISSAQALRIEARVTRTGNVTPQPGDLSGTSPVVKPGARDVKVVVDKVIP